MKNTKLDRDPGPLRLLQMQTPESFFCFRCGTQKRGKSKGELRTAEGVKVLCETCYSELLGMRRA